MMTWKRFLVFISSALITIGGVRLAIACGGYDFDSDILSFFQSNITSQPEYQAFNFGDIRDFYGVNELYAIPEETPRQDPNVKEWYDYCKESATVPDIDSLLNRFSYNDLAALTQSGAPASKKVSENTFAKFISKKKNRDVLTYLLFAKKCEPLNASQEEYWDEAIKSFKTPTLEKVRYDHLISEGFSLYTKCRNDFLSWRYAYQIIRLAFHSKQYALTDSLYTKLIGTKTAANVMYPGCLGIKAGSLYHQNRKVEAAYLYSRAFELSEEDYLSFDWCLQKIEMDSVLAFCKNDHERAVICVMDGFRENNNEEYEGLDLLQRAWKYDPKVKGLNLVMTREINKAEERFLAERERREKEQFRNRRRYIGDNEYAKRDENEWKEKKVKYTQYLNNLNNFAQKVAADQQTTDRAFWYLSSAYIYYMQNLDGDCNRYMALAEKEKMTPREQDVHDIIKILCIVSQSPILDKDAEARLMPQLRWIEQRENNNPRFHAVYRDLMSDILANKYLAQKDTIKALFCLGRGYSDGGGFSFSSDFSDFSGILVENMSLTKLHETQQFNERSGKSEFEAWLIQSSPYNADMLREYEGTKYIRQMKFGSAVEVLRKVSAGQLSRFVLPDVLVSHLNDYVTWNTSDSGKLYNKLTFAEKMVELENTLAKEPTNSRAAYQYANALYSMSYYGKGCHAYSYKYTNGDDNAYYNEPARNKLDSNSREYYSVTRAMKYYLITANNTTDREVQARCLFLASKCWQKNCPVDGQKDDTAPELFGDYYQFSKSSPYFKRLKQEYNNTAFYKTAVGTCSYFRDYVKKN